MKRFPLISTILFTAALFAPFAVDGEIWVDQGTGKAGASGSKTSPFKTVAAALQAAKPGDTVIIRGGVYRESLAIPGGTGDRPLTVMAGPGERVILSGTEPVAGWKKYKDNIWVTVVATEPDKLMVALKEQPLSREPNDGWWTLASWKDNVLTDENHLKGYQTDIRGAQVRIWQRHFGRISGC